MRLFIIILAGIGVVWAEAELTMPIAVHHPQIWLTLVFATFVATYLTVVKIHKYVNV